MKSLIIFFLLSSCLLFLYCSDPITTEDFIQKENPSSGFWEINLKGDLSGAATIPVPDNGFINNGIPIPFGSAKVNTYIKGTITKTGILEATFSNNYNSGNIKIISFGSFVGNFSDSTSSGSYQLMVNDSVNYSGTWSGYRIE